MKNNIESLINAGKLEDAKFLLAEFSGMGGMDWEIYSMNGVIAILENRLEEAETVLLEGIELYSHCFDLLYNLGYTYQVGNKTDLAISYYGRALEVAVDPEIKDQIRKSIQQLVENHAESKPLVSIVLLAYNHLDYTKLAVESIYKYTSHINFELITVNNGSSDGTREYFDSLPNKKKIHLDENVGPVNGFNIGMKAAEGKYTAAVCNDFIFTTRWLDNLLICIESDEKIGFVSPGSSNISNHQMIQGNYSNLEEMQRFAEQYNQSDASKWEERVRLLPCVLMVRTDLLKEIGYFDPEFYFGEFADDDISFRIRRAGYKLIFARDTFTYHFGSITTGVDQKENSSLEVSRKIFMEKHGIDSWNDANFDLNLVSSLDVTSNQESVSILGINSRCGGTPLQLKNKLNEHGLHNVSIDNFTEDRKYLIDLKTVSERSACGNVVDIKHLFADRKYDYIIFGEGIERCNSIEQTVADLVTLMKNDGQLVFKIRNGSNYIRVANLILGNVLSNENEPQVTYLNKEKFLSILIKHGLVIKSVIAVTQEVPSGDKEIIKYLAGVSTNQKEATESMLSTLDYIITATLS
ncbi:glycosyltransferase [Paenibacillus aceris]|uniref:GT2 family glycosyltransferase n=1 Tax=Paenibacillus aceris TaxID=869555 RepID=A0ABS4I5W7_9BACL|nr:glycosyltransferase [Paenibacillus aceris]MBP1965811.1 GT2 family glycosyltransferase [Paenibacillus aceris]NHW34843.1 glycosyltransferase [Paenibacillus aceris]